MLQLVKVCCTFIGITQIFVHIVNIIIIIIMGNNQLHVFHTCIGGGGVYEGGG